MKLYRCMNKKEFNEAVELGLQMHCLKGGSFCFLPENIPAGNGATITPADVLPCIRDGEILVEFEAPDAMLPQPVLGSYDDPFAEEDEWGAFRALLSRNTISRHTTVGTLCPCGTPYGGGSGIISIPLPSPTRRRRNEVSTPQG